VDPNDGRVCVSKVEQLRQLPLELARFLEERDRTASGVLVIAATGEP
jgi:hypothetical protein